MLQSDVLDRAVLDDLLDSVGGDASFLAELIDTYLADSTGLVAELHRALAAGDTDAFRRAAHTLKSSSASLGAASLSARWKELEMIARGGTLDGAAERLAGAEPAYEKVRAALEQVKQESGG